MKLDITSSAWDWSSTIYYTATFVLPSMIKKRCCAALNILRGMPPTAVVGLLTYDPCAVCQTCWKQWWACQTGYRLSGCVECWKRCYALVFHRKFKSFRVFRSPIFLYLSTTLWVSLLTPLVPCKLFSSKPKHKMTPSAQSHEICPAPKQRSEKFQSLTNMAVKEKRSTM